MTWKTVSLFVVGMCAALAFGIWIGPSAQDRLASVTNAGAYDMEPATTPPGRDWQPDVDTTVAPVAETQTRKPMTRAAIDARESGSAESRAGRAEGLTPATVTDNRDDGIDDARIQPIEARRVHPMIASGTHSGVMISPGLAKQVKPLLKSGANVSIAADGFRSAAEFVTVARASKNTGVPFMLLKHRVVAEGNSLAKAIESSKPELDGSTEAQRAAAEARVDMASIAG